MKEKVFKKSLKRGATDLGVELDSTQLQQLAVYCRELEKWNRNINLVSRKEHNWTRVHFLDSLVPLGMGLLEGSERVVDLGAGAGFPGLVLKIGSPGLEACLAEASGKKCAFLRHIIRTLEIKGAWVLEGRFEEIADSGAGEFDLAVSRASAKPHLILKSAGPLLKEGGRTLIYTTEDLIDKTTGETHPYRISGSPREWVIWEVVKE
ncbi:MAG: 16S rRNA (guanine(527)-N(7))-methyltransferase RsmG [bacterium]